MKPIYFILCLLTFISFTAEALNHSRDTIGIFQIVELTSPSLLQGVLIKVERERGSQLLSDTRLRDADGKLLEFNSRTEALNFLEANGWEAISSFSTDEFEVKFVLKRKSADAILLRYPNRE
jgi:hypothetical protein